MIQSDLAFGPMSGEVIESIFRYSDYNHRQLMMICSRNQVDYDHGYVCRTSEIKELIDKYSRIYRQSNVRICRDHCGPGFGTTDDSLDLVKETIRNDILNGFDLIHIDLCHWWGSYSDRLIRSVDLIKFAQSLSSQVSFEIGTDENIGTPEENHKRIERDVDYFLDFCLPEFYVVQTGSLVKEISNVGQFNQESVRRISDVLHQKNIKLKEHNADYLGREQIKQRHEIVDGLNVAPQLGVIQTTVIFCKAIQYGVDLSAFIDCVYRQNNWRKWILPGNETNKMLCAMVAGHYHFRSDEYRKIYDSLEQYCPIRADIISSVSNVMNHYGENT